VAGGSFLTAFKKGGADKKIWGVFLMWVKRKGFLTRSKNIISDNMFPMGQNMGNMGVFPQKRGKAEGQILRIWGIFF
jgi:hypothetical protein